MDNIIEILTECPKCDEAQYAEIALFVAERGPGFVDMKCNPSKINCVECGFDFEFYFYGTLEENEC